MDTERDGDPVYGSYVDFKMPSPMQYFSVDFIGRSTDFELANVPDEVDIYVSANGTDWTQCGRISNMQKQVAKGGTAVNFGNFNAGQPLHYIRWAVVKGGANGATDFRASKTRIYWDARNINIYAK